jgi:hypothetical protein
MKNGILNGFMGNPDVIVIGAGLAGLTCATQLQSAGHSVLVLDKSRGIGGRVATRRHEETCVDHGLPAWEHQGAATQAVCESLSAAGVIRALSLPAPCPEQFASPLGMTQGTKWLARELQVWRSWQLARLNVGAIGWQLTSTKPAVAPLYAPRVVLAIPAPQAVEILQTIPLRREILDPLRSVQFHPCLTVMAGYERLDLSRVAFRTPSPDPRLAVIIADSHKRPPEAETTLVLHSSPEFAHKHLDAPDYVEQAQKTLLPLAAKQLQLSAIATPDWVQVHRWRYARTRTPLGAAYWSAPTQYPLVCCGDWCLGDRAEDALISGQAAARWLTKSA